MNTNLRLRRTQLAVALGALGPALLLTWLFLGVEEIPDEHDIKFEFFAKQHPTFRLKFRNPVTCGVCDTRPYEHLTADDRAQFLAFCRHRFGLDNVNECYAIFVEHQRSADQLLSGAGGAEGRGQP